MAVELSGLSGIGTKAQAGVGLPGNSAGYDACTRSRSKRMAARLDKARIE